MSDAGWAVLFFLVFAWIGAAGDDAFIILIVVLCLWMWARYKRTGQPPHLSRMINGLFTKKRHRRRR